MKTRAQISSAAVSARFPLILSLLLWCIPASLWANATAPGEVLSPARGEYDFQLVGEELSESLIQFSHQSGLAIVFSDSLTRGIGSPHVVGKMSAREALKRLLGDTELTWRLIDERIVAIYDGSCRSDDSCPASTDLLVMNPLYVPGIEELFVYGSRLTGSRIKRSTLQGSAPLHLISSPDIELSGAQTIGQILRYVPAVSGNATSTAISNGGDGTATVTLRGLPASNTLVLINGKRVANDGLAGESVDLNSISPAAVERIEILKDGASPIYGSDAIAGVVNIIMKKDFYGFLAEQYAGVSDEGDALAVTTTLQYGTGFKHGSFFASATYFDQGEIKSRHREVSRLADGRDRGGADLRSSATPDARVTLPGGETVIRDRRSGRYRPVDDDDLFNFPDFTSSLVPSDRISLYTSASYDFSELLTGTFEASYIETDAKAQLAPTPVFTAFEQEPIIISADNVYNPFGVEIEDLRRRLVELPPRNQQNNSKVARLGATFEGLYESWSWELAVGWSRSDAKETLSGVINADNLRRGVGPAANCQGADIDDCVPINLFGRPGSVTREQLNFLRVPSEVDGESKLLSVGFTAFRRLFDLPAGPLEFAFGAEHRDESTEKKPDRVLADLGTIGGTNFEATDGDRNVSEVFFESVAPVWADREAGRHFDLELALRYSHYDDFGQTTNPKVGLRLQASPDILLRGTWSQGFRAPTLNELYQGQTEDQAFISDPCTQQSNVGRLPGCEQQADPSRNQFLTVTGGNDKLDEENSVSKGIGLVWTPGFLPGFSASADYFDIDIDNVVDSSAQFIVNQNAAFGRFEDRIERDDMGNLQLVTATNLNVGDRQVRGVDVSLDYRLPTRAWGQFSAAVDLSWITEYSNQLDENSPKQDLAGTFIDPASEGLGGIPEWKGNFGIQWARQRWRGSYDLHYVSNMEETVPNSNRQRHIESWLVHDLQFSYVFNVAQGLRIAAGIDNLLDEEVPFAASAFNDNYDGRTHELRGRFWYAKLSQRL